MKPLGKCRDKAGEVGARLRRCINATIVDDHPGVTVANQQIGDGVDLIVHQPGINDHVIQQINAGNLSFEPVAQHWDHFVVARRHRTQLTFERAVTAQVEAGSSHGYDSIFHIGGHLFSKAHIGSHPWQCSSRLHHDEVCRNRALQLRLNPIIGADHNARQMTPLALLP